MKEGGDFIVWFLGCFSEALGAVQTASQLLEIMRQSRRGNPGMVIRAWDRCEQGNPNLGSEEIKEETLTPLAGGQETS